MQLSHAVRLEPVRCAQADAQSDHDEGDADAGNDDDADGGVDDAADDDVNDDVYEKCQS